LGWHFAGHQGLHQSRSGVAANQQAAGGNGSARICAARAPRPLSRICQPRGISGAASARKACTGRRRRRLRSSMTTKPGKITALAGGVGASKLLLGLYDVLPDPAQLTAIVNTGDDIALHGLKISPDLDIVTYTLAGVVDSAKGWGFRGETFHLLK